jgi:thiamine biosynthesis lipoprotein
MTLDKELPPLRRFLLPALFVGALFVVLFLRGRPADGPVDVVLHGPTMGTTWTVKVVAISMDDTVRTALQATLQETVDQVDLRMSTWKPESELSRLNAHDTTPFELSPQLADVLSEAERVHHFTGGAFDITVGPLVNAYGFGPGDAPSPPSDAQLRELRTLIGQSKLVLGKAGKSGKRSARKKSPSLYCDLSGIAKGYGVDQAANALEGLGYRDYMVEIGGEVRAHGRNRSGEVWRIGVEMPDTDSRAVRDVIPLLDGAMATSGEYRNFYEVDGVRYSHTIDPRSGQPIQHRLASVTVLHDSCMTADALATAMNVLGPDDGFELAIETGLAVLFIQEHGSGSLLEHVTPAFEAKVRKARAMTPVEADGILKDQD